MPLYPFHTNPSEVSRLLKLIPSIENIDRGFDASSVNALGFSSRSSSYLIDTLHKLGFVDNQGLPSTVLKQFASSEERGLVLASAIKQAYAGLFKRMVYPYLEADDEIIAFFKQSEAKISSKDLNLLLATFRNLCDLADFQDLAGGLGAAEAQPLYDEKIISLKPDQRLQINLQIHISADMPEDKIEAIFQNMRKYLLNPRE